MRRIEITRNMAALVDDDDYEKISRYSWAFCPNNYPSNGYAIRTYGRINGKKKMISMHREILGVGESVDVDHINGCGLDNRKCNLRIADTQTNAFNRGKPNVASTSQYKGVLRRRNMRNWEARLKYNNKAIHLGRFNSEAEAAAAYNYAAVLMFGEFARLNENVSEPHPNIKAIVYQRCLNMIIKRNWHPTTGVFFVENEAIRNG